MTTNRTVPAPTQAMETTSPPTMNPNTPSEAGEEEKIDGRRGPQRRKKRTRIRAIPPMPRGVKALWDAASDEERSRARTTCTGLLEAWVGKTTRMEIATRLGVTPLRLWQLSQMATAGMLAGLLRQPRRRTGMAHIRLPPDEDPVRLKARVAQLEKELNLAEGLIAILRELPENRAAVREERRPTPSPGSRTAKRKAAAAARKAHTPREKKAARRESPRRADGPGSGSGPLAG